MLTGVYPEGIQSCPTKSLSKERITIQVKLHIIPPTWKTKLVRKGFNYVEHHGGTAHTNLFVTITKTVKFLTSPTRKRHNHAKQGICKAGEASLKDTKSTGANVFSEGWLN